MPLGWRHLLPLFGAIPNGGRVVRDGNVITGGGVPAGIDVALVALPEITGVEAAQAIQRGPVYAPSTPFDAGRPDTAPPAVLDLCNARMAPMLAGRPAAKSRTDRISVPFARVSVSSASTPQVQRTTPRSWASVLDARRSEDSHRDFGAHGHQRSADEHAGDLQKPCCYQVSHCNKKVRGATNFLISVNIDSDDAVHKKPAFQASSPRLRAGPSRSAFFSRH